MRQHAAPRRSRESRGNMIEESEKSPLAVLAVIIFSLLAYNCLVLREPESVVQADESRVLQSAAYGE